MDYEYEGSVDLYLKDIRAYRPLRSEEEADLARKIRQGDQKALDRMITSNLRFVVSIAKKYLGRGLPLADLIAEGNTGVMEAAHRFDEARGFRFITYAVWWIRQAILKALAEQRKVVRSPLSHYDDLEEIGRKRDHLSQELEHEPTPEELANETDLALARVERALALIKSDLSLDSPLTSYDDMSLMDILHDEKVMTDQSLLERDMNEVIQRSLSGLEDREAEVIRLYFGLDSEESMTLEEIGTRLGITRERVRQIRNRAIDRIRHRYRDLLLPYSPN